MSGFQFKEFFVRHDRCAMKVGTDGVLLGALAEGGKRILDIGTGSGLCALMMAQRFPYATVTGIDIDEAACIQAHTNALESPFKERIRIIHSGFEEFVNDTLCCDNETAGAYENDTANAYENDTLCCDNDNYNNNNKNGRSFDAIISNPPFFEESLECPDGQRTLARHTSSLPYSTLLSLSSQLLTEEGTLTLILPTDRVSRIEEECAYNSLFIIKRIHIKTTPRKQPKRTLLFIAHHPAKASHDSKESHEATDCPITEEQVLMQDGMRSPWFAAVTKDFYL